MVLMFAFCCGLAVDFGITVFSGSQGSNKVAFPISSIFICIATGGTLASARQDRKAYKVDQSVD